MFESWMARGNWTHEQWLIFSLTAFIVVAALVILVRLYAIFKMATTKRERPNLRVAHRLRKK
ncbi:MAG: hypothetical protein Q8L60_02855 [Gammaproteobacteria bacterium]|nr:hypothetical protein [Gammaproteobacteria bacterium]MDP2142371.1 hypothetical protein [Gammaproteobacteria bacterium]MDP2348612.1 hypothetical protein [Gammaproteobacteria bacterium]